MESFAPTARAVLRIQDVAPSPSEQPIIDIQPPHQPPAGGAPNPESRGPVKKLKDRAPRQPRPSRQKTGVAVVIFVACVFALAIAGIMVYTYLQTN